MSTNEEIASRFAPYVSELHELFGMHGVSFGTPADLPALVEKLDTGGLLAEDVSSILRSMILREGGSVPQTELLEVVALAAAGPNLDPTVPEVQPAFRRLLSFVGTIARRPWNIPPGDPPMAATDDIAPAAPHLPQAVQSEPAPLQQVALAGAAAQASTTPALPAGFRPFARRTVPEEPDSAATDGIPPPVPHSGRNPSWPLWIAAACAILAVLLLVHFERAHPPGDYPQVTVAAAPATPAATVPAPATGSPSGAARVPARPPGSSASSGTAKPSAGVPVPRHPTTSSATSPPRPAPSSPARVTATPPVVPTQSSRVPGPAPAATSPAQVGIPAAPVHTAAHPAPPSPATETAENSTVAPLRRPAIALPRGSSHGSHGGTFQVSPGVMDSHLIRSWEPGYPMLARMAHVEGPVVLEALISSEGEVVSAHAVSGHHLLRGAAASAVKQWQYRPFLVDGHPVNVATTITVNFRERH